MSDKCYICHEDEGILRKTCKNKKCTAKTHSPCLQKQYVTLKKCGVCKSDIIINRNFNYVKLIKFLFKNVNLLFTMSIFILHSYIIFTLIMGLNPLDHSDPKFNDITVIAKEDIYSTNYLIFGLVSVFNFIIYMSSSLFEGDKLLDELNHKYGKIGLVILLFVHEIILILTCHIIGYYIFRIFSDFNIEFYTYKTFLVGTPFLSCTPLIVLLLFVIYKYALPSILEPFYDLQFGQ